MFARIIVAIIVGIAVYLSCVFFGILLGAFSIADWVVITGNFLKQYASAISLLAALYQFVMGKPR